mmetsp:Transcript_37700/g.82007  ORF Transcript_37700/g.82007 Transcript_37700/m.82007 type:complete len:214 (-) Transcript_37700:48-689(-)
MSGVSFALNKGKRKRAIMKEAKEALKLEKHEANTEQVTHGMEGLNSQQRSEALEELRNKGSDLALEGKFGQALQTWDRILRVEPDNAVVHELRAQVYLEMDETWHSIQAATRATELRPEWAEALVTLGRAQLAYGEAELAVKSLQQGLKLKPDIEGAQADLDAVRVLILQQKRENPGSEAGALQRITVKAEGVVLNKPVAHQGEDGESRGGEC